MPSTLTKIVEDRIKAWELEKLRKKRFVTQNEVLPVITISREFGSRGAALAEWIGERTGFKVWDREILQAIADEHGSNHNLLETLDENRRELIEDAILGLLQNVNTNVNYLRTLIKLVKTIEEHGNAIIVGRGSNYICEDPRSFHVRVVSPVKTRAAEYAERKGLKINEALADIERIDKERADFVSYNFKKSVNNSSDYDIILNSGTLNLDAMMNIVVEAYRHKTGRTPEILKAKAGIGLND
jgi:cytidylate kinase